MGDFHWERCKTDFAYSSSHIPSLPTPISPTVKYDLIPVSPTLSDFSYIEDLTRVAI